MSMIGDNLPPDAINTLRINLEEKHHELIDRYQDLMQAAGRAPDVVTDDVESGKMGDFIKQISGCMKMLDTARVSEKKPYDDLATTVHTFFKAMLDRLERTKAQINQRQTVYLREKARKEQERRDEEARLAREEADRRRREAEEAARALKTEEDLPEAVSKETAADLAAADLATANKAAQAPAADMSRTRGDLNSVSSLRTFWDFEGLDRDTLDLETLRHHLPMAALETAVRSFIKAGGRDLKGVKIFQNQVAATR